MVTANSIEDLLKDPKQLKSTSATKTKATASKASDDQSPTAKLSQKLTDISLQEQEQKIQKKAFQQGLPYIDLIGFPISPETIAIIPRQTAEELKVICFLYVGQEIRIGAVNPNDEKIKELAYQIGERMRGKVEIYQISDHSFEITAKLYDKIPVYKKPPKGIEITEKDLLKYENLGNDFTKLNESLKKITNLTEMTSLIIAAALQSGSSDIHIETEEDEVKIRLRVDGILHDAASLQKEIWTQLIARIKQVSGLKININDKPQDGRFTILKSDEEIDVRVSTLPTSYGESVVMRILKSSAASLQFEDLGLFGIAKTRLEKESSKPHGMIITTGPTGSGKTTTLYAILNKLNKEGTKIITLEDPIEYRLKGINQSQIDHSKKYSFADGLRSILRQDPDIVMVGEIRDLETADVAVNAALTGHLVISTIHTNNAAGAIPRLMNMGVKGHFLAPAINTIMGQRLVRRICENCKTEYQPTPEELEIIKSELNKIPSDHPDRPKMDNLKFYIGQGCEKCNNLKYKGRIGIYEIMVLNEQMRKNIISGTPSTDDIEKWATENQMLTMLQDGLIKASQGITSIEEVFRVAQ